MPSAQVRCQRALSAHWCVAGVHWVTWSAQLSTGLNLPSGNDLRWNFLEKRANRIVDTIRHFRARPAAASWLPVSCIADLGVLSARCVQRENYPLLLSTSWSKYLVALRLRRVEIGSHNDSRRLVSDAW